MSVVRPRIILATSFLGVALVVMATVLAFSLVGGANSAPDAGTPAVSRIVYEQEERGEIRVLEIGAASPAQSSALTDGFVTRSEYESAVWAAFECIRQRGYEPLSEPNADASGIRLQYSFRSSGDSEQGDVGRSCREQHSLFVEMSWAVQNTPSESQSAAARAALKQCLLRTGHPPELVEPQTNLSELSELGKPEFGDCVRQISSEFGTTGF